VVPQVGNYLGEGKNNKATKSRGRAPKAERKKRNYKVKNTENVSGQRKKISLLSSFARVGQLQL